MINDKEARFCQKCGCFQLLAEFDGDKRSCRVRLSEHNRRQRRLRALRLKDTTEDLAVEKRQGHTTTTRSASIEGTALQAPQAAPPIDNDVFAARVEPVLDTLSMDELLSLQTVSGVQTFLHEARRGTAAMFVPPSLDGQYALGSEDEDAALEWLGSGSDEAPSTSAIDGSETN